MINESYTVVHTDTLQKYQELMEMLDKTEHHWADGISPTKRSSVWVNYKENTCVALRKHGMTFSPLSYYKAQPQKCNVISFDQYKKGYKNENNTHPPNLNRRIIDLINEKP